MRTQRAFKLGAKFTYVLLLNIVFGFLSLSPDLHSKSESIDLSVCFSVDEHIVTKYALEKYNRRHSSSFIQSHGREPSPPETAEWFRTFLMTQVVIAEAVKEGYLRRISVIDTVDKMEKNMLSTPAGPWYEFLANNQTSIESGAGHIADPISVQSARRAAVIRNASISIEKDEAGDLTDLLQSLPRGTSFIPEEVIQSKKNRHLFTFSLLSDRRLVAVGDFASEFNSLFVRSIPKTLDSLNDSIIDYVVRQTDIAESILNEIHQTPKFLADKESFAQFQALELFYQERLLQHPPTEAQAHEYFRKNISEFREVYNAEVTQLTFSSPSEAVRWLEAGQPKPDSNTHSLTSAVLVLDRNTKVDGIADAHRDLFIESKEGSIIGPILKYGSAIVFVRGKTLSHSHKVFEDVKSQILIRLELETRDRRLMSFANEIIGTKRIVDNISYSDFGIEPESKEFPWR